MLAASGQAMIVLDEQGCIVYSSQLADDLLEITSDPADNTRRRIGAKFKTLQNEPVTSFCDFKPADFPLLLLSSRDGKPERLLKVLGLPKRGTYLIQDR